MERLPERSAAPERTDSSERPTAAGPPRIALAGNKPTWRERQAQKEKEAAGAGQALPSVPPSDIATTEAQLPKKTTGYLPPAKRGDTAPRGRPTDNLTSQPPRDESSGDGAARWRPSAGRETAGREDSPANGPPARALPPSRRPDAQPARADSPADGAGPAKFVPPHLREGGPPSRGEAPPPAPARTASPADGGAGSTGKWQPRFKRGT